MLKQYSKWLFLVLVVLTSACARRPKTEDLVKLDKKKDAVLLHTVDSLAQLRPKTFYSKIKCRFSDTTKNVSFRTSLRIVKDSAINTLITYASIPIINALITPDSLKISNRKDKCAIRTTMSYIEQTFGVDFEYRNIEELLIGIPVAYDSTDKYFVINDPYNYIVSSHRKRKIKREIRIKPEREQQRERENHRRFDRDKDKDDNFIIQYYLHPNLKSIKRIIVNSPEDTTQISIDYNSRDSIESFLVPKEVLVTIVTPRNKIVLSMEYDKSEVNKPQEIYFVIPEDYSNCADEK
jgi:hypothetical protein